MVEEMKQDSNSSKSKQRLNNIDTTFKLAKNEIRSQYKVAKDQIN
jgi:hypothetical protein